MRAGALLQAGPGDAANRSACKRRQGLEAALFASGRPIDNSGRGSGRPIYKKASVFKQALKGLIRLSF